MQYKILVLLDKKDFKYLHDLKDQTIQTEDEKAILYRMFEGKYNQEWYRRVIRAGLTSLLKDFEKKKKELQDEN